MDMCVDVTREDEFARTFNSPRALRDFGVVRQSDGGDAIAFDHERAIMNHGRTRRIDDGGVDQSDLFGVRGR